MPAIKGHNLNPRWTLTRRVAYDADEEDDQDSRSLQSVQAVCQNPSPNTKSFGDLARVHLGSTGSPRKRFPADGLPTRTSKPRDSISKPKAQEKVSTPRRIEAGSEKNDSVSNEASKDWRDDWLILTPSNVQNGVHGKWLIHSLHHQEFVPVPIQPKAKRQRIRQPKKSKDSSTNFVDLPPEIRNAIYECVIPASTVRILRTHPVKEARERYREAQHNWTPEYFDRKSVKSRLRHDPGVRCSSEDFSIGVNLMLTSRKIKTEVETFFYSRIQFSFLELKPLRRFLRTAPEAGIRAIRKMYLLQGGYGNANVSENQIHRDKYYQHWQDVCTLLGEKIPTIKHLKLDIHDREWPCMLSGEDYNPAWKASILTIAPHKAPKVEVRISHQMIDRNRDLLKELARNIEDSLMTQDGRDERDRMETERVLAEIAHRKAVKQEKEPERLAKRNAPKELVISMGDVQKSVSEVSAKNKVRNTGLEKFSKAEPDFCCMPLQ